MQHIVTEQDRREWRGILRDVLRHMPGWRRYPRSVRDDVIDYHLRQVVGALRSGVSPKELAKRYGVEVTERRGEV